MLRTEQLSKRFDSFCLRDISFEVARGEYYVLLGRSGAGKTQLLEVMCGLSKPDAGRVFLDGEDITHKKVQDRNIGLVFQDLALFPHYSVKDNIMYPLKLMKLTQAERLARVNHAAEEMNITDLLLRKPGNLSGGEKQRVALARTLVTEPKILLLDEPMASVDASLKDSIRRMLRRLNRNGQTIVHVTHDFGEAVSLASRVGVMHNGSIIQEGTPAEVFDHPVNRFVARYAGFKNFFRVTFVRSYNTWSCITDNRTKFRLTQGEYPSSGLLIIAAGEVLVSRQGAAGVQINNIHGVIDDVVPSPTGYEITVIAGDKFYADITHREMAEQKFVAGEQVIVSFRPESLRLVGNGEDKREY